MGVRTCLEFLLFLRKMVYANPFLVFGALLYLQVFTASAAPNPSQTPAMIVPSGATFAYPNPSIQGEINQPLTVPKPTTQSPPPPTSSPPPAPPLEPSTTTTPLPTPSANCAKQNFGVGVYYTLTGNALMNETNIGEAGSVLEHSLRICGVMTSWSFNPGVLNAQIQKDPHALGNWEAQFTFPLDCGKCVMQMLRNIGPKAATVSGRCNFVDG